MNKIVSLLLVLTTAAYFMYSVYVLQPDDLMPVLSWGFISIFALVGFSKIFNNADTQISGGANNE